MAIFKPFARRCQRYFPRLRPESGGEHVGRQGRGAAAARQREIARVETHDLHNKALLRLKRDLQCPY